MTPFEAATQLYQHTAENSALNDLGDEGRINAARMFELAKMQKENDLYVGRNASELSERQRIAQLDRLQQKNEGANALFSKAKQFGYAGPDDKKSLDDNISDAQKVLNQQTLEGYKGVVAKRDDAQKQAMDLLDKLGANKPIDQTRLNQMILQDPSLVKVLNASDRAKLAAGTTPEDLAKGFFYSSNKSALLTAAQTARAALQSEQQQIAQAKAGQAFKLLESRYAEHNELAGQLLKSLPPEMVGQALALGAPSSSGITGPALNGNGLLTNLAAPGAAGDNPEPSTAAVPPVNPGAKSGGKDDPILQSVDMQNAQNLYEDADARVKASSGQLDLLSGKIVAGKGLPANERADLSKQYLAAKKDNEKAKQDLQDALTRAQSVYHNNVNSNANFFSKVGYNPIGTNTVPLNPNGMNNGFSGPGQPAPVQPTLTLPPGARTIQDIIGQPQPNTVAPTNTTTPNATSPTNSPGAMTQPNVDPMQLRSGQNQVARLLGASDPSVLYAARNYAKTNLGMDDNTINNLVQAAVKGDPNALQTARQIVARVSQQGNQPQSAPLQPTPTPDFQSSLPPVPAYA